MSSERRYILSDLTSDEVDMIIRNRIKTPRRYMVTFTALSVACVAAFVAAVLTGLQVTYFLTGLLAGTSVYAWVDIWRFQDRAAREFRRKLESDTLDAPDAPGGPADDVR